MKKAGMILAMSMVFLFGIFAPDAQARSYEITNYDVWVEIQEDGSADFTEKITYDFDGAFNGIFYHLDISGIETPTDIQVSVQDEGQRQADRFTQTDSEEPGTYTLENTGDFLNFTVYNPAEDETKTVIYQYRIPQIVTNYNDVAEFNRKVIGEKWDETLGNVAVTITLPEAVGEGELRAWGHGDRTGKVSLENNQFVHLDLPENPSNRFVEAHVIFPPSVTAANPNKIAADQYEKIMRSEQELAEQKERKSRIFFILAILVGLLGPVFAWIAFIWMRRKHKEANPQPLPMPQYTKELPADLSPAVMNAAVFKKYPGVTEVTATITNLARMGYVRVEESGDAAGKTIFGKEQRNYRLIRQKATDDQLLAHEEQLLHWFIDVIGNGSEVTLEEIEEAGKDKKQAKKFTAEQEKWVKSVEEDAEPLKEAFHAEYGNQAAGVIILTLIGTVLVLFLTGLLIGLGQTNYWILALPIFGIAGTILLIGYYLKNPPLTTAGDRAYKEWTGFRNMLADPNRFPIKPNDPKEKWELYLVYAIALGVEDAVLDRMEGTYRQEEWYQDEWEGYYFYPNNVFMYSLHQSISQGVTSAAGTTGSSSSSSGMGGGFSGGSSGGTGGGSGGGAF